MSSSTVGRGSWTSGLGFILAAAGSAVGLGNVWRFPYIIGENGGGLFVLVYLICVLLVGLPIMIAEILIGRAAQRSTVSAFKQLAGERSPWVGLGWLGVVAAFLILSYYAVVAGWTLHYTLLSATGTLAGKSTQEIQEIFQSLSADAGLSLLWLVVFMALTVTGVLGGVRGGIERWSRVLMPALLVMLLGLLANSMTLAGFGRALDFVFGFHVGELTGGGVLEAMGQAFFSLSLGMGGMLTYGSYLRRDSDIVGNSFWIAGLDTVIAVLAALVIFPIAFTFALAPSQGPGLIFTNLPVAFARLPAGSLVATVFFALLVFAALTSTISLLEVATAYFIDDRGWSRKRATLVAGGVITLLGVPSALTGSSRFFGADLEGRIGADWFTLLGNITSNWMLPVGGMAMALFVGWRLGERVRRDEFLSGSAFGRLYGIWLTLVRFLVPAAVLAVFLRAIGVF